LNISLVDRVDAADRDKRGYRLLARNA